MTMTDVLKKWVLEVERVKVENQSESYTVWVMCMFVIYVRLIYLHVSVVGN